MLQGKKGEEAAVGSWEARRDSERTHVREDGKEQD
jgi:hypothetical protein